MEADISIFSFSGIFQIFPNKYATLIIKKKITDNKRQSILTYLSIINLVQLHSYYSQKAKQSYSILYLARRTYSDFQIGSVHPLQLPGNHSAPLPIESVVFLVKDSGAQTLPSHPVTTCGSEYEKQRRMQNSAKNWRLLD